MTRTRFSTVATGALLALLGCGSRDAAPPAAPAAPAASATPPTPAAAAPAALAWTAGKGVTGCAIGERLAACEVSLGAARRDGDYAHFDAAGVEVRVDGDTVRAVFVEYQSTTKQPFAGTDAHGIGAGATPEDVVRAYGAPLDESDSIVSEYGEFPGKRDHTMSYPGASFTFLDEILGHVAITAPRPAGAE